jgi:probable dihydroxyacetone kinase regulator
MSQFTKKAIEQTLIELLNERPFDKITVTDIVERCGINRNTFYYYFHDIYALIDELFRNETQAIVTENYTYDSWMDGFACATKFALENKSAIYHLYNSLCRERLERYLNDVIRSITAAFVASQATGLHVQESDQRIITDFHTGALTSLILEWLRNGMTTDPMQYVGRLAQLLDGSIRYALEKSDPTYTSKSKRAV